jgi:DNA-binding beta-propeller fold protein YncE
MMKLEMMMKIGSDDYRYEWLDNWARIPDTESGRENGRTHGVVVTEAGKVIVFHQATPAVLVFDADGALLDQWGDFAGAHGITLVKEGEQEFLWLTDQNSNAVVKTTLDGEVVMSIPQPDLPLYDDGGYCPTWVAVNEERHGGNGDVWVTDGYGSGYVHRHDKHGKYISSINGSEGAAGSFACPHGILFDSRKKTPELLIADRGNHRVQVYDGDGNYKRTFGEDFLTSPDCFAISGDDLIVPELFASLKLLDAEDKLICDLGENAAACKIDGWPNLDASQIHAGKFNSPHGAAADKDGNLYCVEWIIGGRITKLIKE